MKKLFKTLTAGFLAATLICSASACGLNESNGSTGGGDVADTTLVRERYTYEGTHIMTAPELDNEYLVRNGDTDYVLLTPASPESNEKIAIEEFQTFFKKATDIDINIVRDDSEGITLNDRQKYISIGNTELVTKLTDAEKKSYLGFDVKQLGVDGVRIVKKNNTVYILGGSDSGVLYAVYDFLQICFNYEFYYTNCIEIDTGVRNLKMRNFDVTDIPDAQNRTTGNPVSLRSKLFDFEIESGLVGTDDINRNTKRYREVNVAYEYLPTFKYYGNPGVRVYGYHSSDYFAYPGCEDRNGNAVWESNWGGDDGIQLCYTAHGDEESLERLIDLVVDKIVYIFEEYPEYADRHYCGFTTMDGGSQCMCATCTAAYEKDGNSWSGQIIRVCNRVMEKVQKWRAEHGMDDNFTLFFFAYGPTDQAPVIEDANGNYIPANDEVICRDDVATLLCLSNYTTELYWPTAEYQQKLDLVEKWGAVTSKMFNWLYQMRYLGYSTYVDSITQLNSDFYAYLLNYGSLSLKNQGDWQGDSITGWGVLNEYLFSKLMWNSSLKMEDLVNKYFKAMFKDASDTMLEIFNMQREQSATITQNPNVGITVGTNADKKENNPYTPYLLPIINLYEKALSEIAYLETTSSGEYVLTKSHIENEYVAPLYLALSLYGSDVVRPFNDETKQIYKNKLIEITDGIFYRIAENVQTTMHDYALGV